MNYRLHSTEPATDRRPYAIDVYLALPCPCQAAARKERYDRVMAQISEREGQEKAIRMRLNKDRCGIKECLQWTKHRLTNYDTSRHPSLAEAHAAAEDVVELIRGGGTYGVEGLIFASAWERTNSAGKPKPETGIGKSHLAIAVAIAALNMGYSARCYTLARYLDKQRSEYGHRPGVVVGEILEACITTDILVLDDFCQERIADGEKGDWTREQLYKLIDERTKRHLPILMTTNRPSYESIEEHIGGTQGTAIVSRLKGATVWVAMTGPDYRERK